MQTSHRLDTCVLNLLLLRSVVCIASTMRYARPLLRRYNATSLGGGCQWHCIQNLQIREVIASRTRSRVFDPPGGNRQGAQRVRYWFLYRRNLRVRSLTWGGFHPIRHGPHGASVVERPTAFGAGLLVPHLPEGLLIPFPTSSMAIRGLTLT